MAERDDWFEDVEQEPAALENDPASAEDDWLVPLPPPARQRPKLPDRRVLVIAGAFVVLLIAGLAAGGVFSSSSSKPPAPITTASITTPTTTAATGPSVKVIPSTTLKPGDTGAQVKALQRALKSLGYSVGAIDGQYGPTTKEAVASFQHDERLTADGIFGPKTLNALIQRAGP
ncbi:MAG TPA: peptidoglycan-binding domain-containing protein [Gaiellaceae bacterium]|nr:peptidoglycan-binding domain-containing protein [Gaiellaceae bacterium]